MTATSEPQGVIETITVDYIRFAQQLRLSEEFVQDVKFDVFQDPRTAQTILNFHRKIPAVCGPDVRVPLTWWDHFKQRFFRGYLRNRFPICYQTYQAREYLPDLPQPIREKAGTTSFASFAQVYRDNRTFEQRMREEEREEREQERLTQKLRDRE